MRFEMGMELAERLPKTAEVAVRHAVAALPSITPIGMAALQPGASASFNVVEQGGKLGARIDDAFLPDLAARKKFAAARVPKLVDIALDELLSLQPRSSPRRSRGTSHRRAIAGDRPRRRGWLHVPGSSGHGHGHRQPGARDPQAGGGRRRALGRVSADHGHLFFPVDRDESMRIDAPGRRHGRAASSLLDWARRRDAGWMRSRRSGGTWVTQSDLEFVFPIGAGVFKAGGDLAFHHGGPSLQELIIPVLTVRLTVG